jgi:DNA-binding response OmpR family regulator
MNILLVEDEKKIVDFVCYGFREQGFTVDCCIEMSFLIFTVF